MHGGRSRKATFVEQAQEAEPLLTSVTADPGKCPYLGRLAYRGRESSESFLALADRHFRKRRNLQGIVVEERDEARAIEGSNFSKNLPMPRSSPQD